MTNTHRIGMVAAGLFLLVSTAGFAAPPPMPKGDPARGKPLYDEECGGCHTFHEHQIGPNHCGVVGRKSGTAPGYNYSEAMRDLGIVWDSKKLNEFLIAPLSYVPNTNMGYAGLSEAQGRADVIAFLGKATPGSEQCKPAAPQE